MIQVSDKVSAVIHALEAAAQAGNREAFVAQAEATDWSTHTPDELLRAIDLALQLELASLAIALAQEGSQRFPDDERLRNAARVLAPPTVLDTRTPPAQGLEETRDWLREHAQLYRGQWVAVRAGQLLGADLSLKTLMARVGQDAHSVSTVITRVL